MTSLQQDERIYPVFLSLTQDGTESASGDGSQLASTNLTSGGELSSSHLHPMSNIYWFTDIFVADFSAESLGHTTCDPSEYSTYGWPTGVPGTYEVTLAACQPLGKSESPEGEGALLSQVTIDTCNAYAQSIRLQDRPFHEPSGAVHG
jgi:hypothetical protein